MIYVVATIASLPVEKLYTINVVRPDSQQVQMGNSSKAASGYCQFALSCFLRTRVASTPLSNGNNSFKKLISIKHFVEQLFPFLLNKTN